jgi:ABC-2 type transport system ATP-binding protein
MKRGRVVALIGALLLIIGVISWGVTRGSAGAVRATSVRIAVVDGPHNDQHVSLDATFYTPADRHGRIPAVLLAHGFGGDKFEVRGEARELAGHGYAVLAWSARGFGRSTGQITLDSPDYDVKDVRQLIDWLAQRPEIELDHPGDPRVGIAGQSYGGGISLLAAAYDPRIDAIAPQITWYDLADALFPDATGAGPSNGVFKKLWAGLLFTNGGSGACGRFLPSICAIYQKVAETGRPTPEAIALLRRSSPSSVVGRIRVPTLLVQGQTDSLFPLDQADENARAIHGAPVKMVWFQGGHDGGDQETSRVEGLVRGWFDTYLKGGGPASTRFTVTRTGGVDSTSQTVTINAATMSHYPGLGGSTRRLVPLGGQPQTIQNPAGGSPAAVSSLPGLGALSGLGALAGAGLSLDVPGQAASFDSKPLSESLETTGSVRVQVTVTPAQTATGDRPGVFFAKLYDVSPAGGAALARRIVAPFTGTGTMTVTLPGMDYRFDSGHRIRLVVSTTDMGYASPAAPAAYRVSVASPLTVPADPQLTAPAPPLPAWTWLLPLAGIIVAAVLLLTGRRRDPVTAEGDAVALRITGLTKAYKNGYLAVDDLSFQVERGQVLGLLGPNGAGKTTTLRMLMGLIRPDAGSIEIFGSTVAPGAPVLSRLGSFVEGPGFLPHLSGRANLSLYWRATGRPTADAHFDEALEIAGLGAAVDRAVRTYSQGMRQRLAIAQAMLGLPDLLVLDEPTNGLDPPQIAEMREVLVGYAAAGCTVIVSSHLLAEVEQTCTHVVVMARGSLVAAGPVGEIVGGAQRLEDVFLSLVGRNGDGDV